MTENEAISKIQWRISTASEIAGKGVDGKAFEDLEIAIQALEKQIPKKPIREHGITLRNKFYKFGAVIFLCSTCARRVMKEKKFCVNCGQKLDWQ